MLEKDKACALAIAGYLQTLSEIKVTELVPLESNG